MCASIITGDSSFSKFYLFEKASPAEDFFRALGQIKFLVADWYSSDCKTECDFGIIQIAAGQQIIVGHFSVF